ncbi:hypothetical protein T4D_9696 [Trichinella pseudospiralis]|uniref:Uncharacterized protein n=1 Tax=Trichinella pseudospiralis TaxID=6337 RepID=A0A0V1F804_TRIPS|nr:hypothetical protein T4D_9696 [Trichinella pseudospiralis]
MGDIARGFHLFHSTLKSESVLESSSEIAQQLCETKGYKVIESPYINASESCASLTLILLKQ